MNKKNFYVDIHVLQTVPPSCVNRDDTGSPKTAVYGGATRARVSSQSWKHAMRAMFSDIFEKKDVGTRTKRVVDMIASKILQHNPDVDEKKAGKLAAEALKLAGLKLKDNDTVTDALFFISDSQAEALAQLAVSEEKEKSLYKNALSKNQRIIAGNAQFTGIAAGRGVGFTTGLLLLRKGLGMRETPIRPHSWHCRMQSGYQYGGNRKRPPVWRRHRGSLRPRGRNLGGVEGMTGGCGSGCDPAIHTRRLRVYHRPRRLRMASRISIFFAARRFEPLNSMG